MSLLLSCFSQLTVTYIKAHSCNDFLCRPLKFENNVIVYVFISFFFKIEKFLRFLLKTENNHQEKFQKICPF